MSTAPPSSVTASPQIVLPSDKVLLHAAKIALESDKPILLDYYAETRVGTAFLGQDKETNERILVKSPEEYTSPIGGLFKVKDDIIVVTANSVYIVSGLIKKKEINTSGM